MHQHQKNISNEHQPEENHTIMSQVLKLVSVVSDIIVENRKLPITEKLLEQCLEIIASLTQFIIM